MASGQILKATRDGKTVRKDELVIVTFDIESTGAYMTPKIAKSARGDDVFAVGFCVGTVRSGVLQKGRFCLKLPRETASQSWASVWSANGYEARCYEQFWSKFESVLDALQDQSDPENNMCHNHVEFDGFFRRLLLEIEAAFGKRWTIYTDTTAFDTVGLSAMLQRSGHFPLLNMQSNGGYHARSTYDVDSALCGVYGIVPGEDPKKHRAFAEARAAYEDHKKEKGIVHDHMPENDAQHIFEEFRFMWNHSPAAQMMTLGESEAVPTSDDDE